MAPATLKIYTYGKASKTEFKPKFLTIRAIMRKSRFTPLTSTARQYTLARPPHAFAFHIQGDRYLRQISMQEYTHTHEHFVGVRWGV